MNLRKERNFRGWVPDYRDFRDYTYNTPEVQHTLGLLNIDYQMENYVAPLMLPGVVDLRQWCSIIEDQGALGSCTANAACNAVEYFEKKAYNNYMHASRLFLYKVTRKLLQWPGDAGGTLRGVMGALVLFGVPPEDFWPYDQKRLEDEPDAFCYAFASNFKGINYFKLDDGCTERTLLLKIKMQLAAGIPSVFGFSVYSSIDDSINGIIPVPVKGDQLIGGHAVFCCGYNDTKQALLIKNSWGEYWGESGYGWLPYDYVLMGLANDWWCMTETGWIDTKQFGFNMEIQ